MPENQSHLEEFIEEAKKRLSKLTPKDILKYGIVCFISLIILVAVLAFKNLMDSPLVFGGMILLFLLVMHISGMTKHLGELTMEAILVIILTVIFIQVSYPIFSPKVDVISSDIVKGYVDDNGEYVFEIYSATVKKPMLMACGSLCGSYCTDISFFNGVWGEVNSPGVNVTKIGTRRAICTYGGFDMMTRLIKFNAAYIQPIDYEILDTNMTSASEYNFTAGRFIYASEINNNMPFPVAFKQKTVLFTITDKTKIPSPEGGGVKWESFYDKAKSNYEKNGCAGEILSRLVSNSIRLSDSTGTVRGYANAVRIDEAKKTMEIDMKISGTLEQDKKYPLQVIYEPVTCLQ